MKILIYKRTHKQDPDINGIFGCQDCMGQVRNWDYDAVIGIGGSNPWKEDAGIRYKINWIGLEPKRINPHPNRGINQVVFKHFELYEEKGESIKDNYPNLFEYMYKCRKRFDMSSNLPKDVFDEIKMILDSIKDSPSSKAYDAVESNDNIETEKKLNFSKCRGCFEGKEIEIAIQEENKTYDYCRSTNS
jgi:hypothetical protein